LINIIITNGKKNIKTTKKNLNQTIKVICFSKKNWLV